MLQLRPNCGLCDKDLPPDAPDARICAYECAFCASCVEETLHDVCPNCGGGFAPRPIRPARAYRSGVGLARHLASGERILTKHGDDDIAAFVNGIRDVPPRDR